MSHAKDYYYLLLDSMIKPLSSSIVVPIEVWSSPIPIPQTKGYYDYYMEVEGQDTSMTDTFDNLFVSILSKEKMDLILFVQPIGSMSMMVSRYDHGGRRNPHQLFKLPGPIAPAILGNIPTTFLASDYLGNYKKPRRWSMPSTKPTKEQLYEKTYQKIRNF